MSAPVRLGLYGLFLVVVFVVAAVAADALVSDETVERWIDDTRETGH